MPFTAESRRNTNLTEIHFGIPTSIHVRLNPISINEQLSIVWSGISQHMVRVEFTTNIQRHVSCVPMMVPAGPLRSVLDAVFEKYPQARGYVLDEHGSLRKHMAVFIGGELTKDRENLSDLVPEGSEVFIMQALSGG
jgi:hypothetical protein